MAPGLRPGFGTIMADAYLCAMPMTYELLSQTPINDTLTALFITIDSIEYSSFSLSAPSFVITVKYVEGNTQNSGITACLYVSDGSNRHYGTRSSSVTLSPGESGGATVPAFSYTGKVLGNIISIGIDVSAPNYSCRTTCSGHSVPITGYLSR